jgi:hypothetical protein
MSPAFVRGRASLKELEQNTEDLILLGNVAKPKHIVSTLRVMVEIVWMSEAERLA